jgi:hypothetical protein
METKINRRNKDEKEPENGKGDVKETSRMLADNGLFCRSGSKSSSIAAKYVDVGVMMRDYIRELITNVGRELPITDIRTTSGFAAFMFKHDLREFDAIQGHVDILKDTLFQKFSDLYFFLDDIEKNFDTYREEYFKAEKDFEKQQADSKAKAEAEVEEIKKKKATIRKKSKAEEMADLATSGSARIIAPSPKKDKLFGSLKKKRDS